MSDYLEEAAALLRKSAAENEKPTTRHGTARTSSETNESRERIAMKFAQLAAIQKGLVPREFADEFLASVRAPDSGWSR